VVHPAFLFVPGGRLSHSELSAARIDGHTVDLGDAYVPADLVESADLRAGTVAAFVRRGTAASCQTAAWIHGALDTPPVVHHLKRCVERRLRSIRDARIVFHDTALAPGDIVMLGGVAVSSPHRTMLDLATTLHRDPRVWPWMEGLESTQPGLAESAGATLSELRRVPGRRIGASALERLALRTR
jgi:hypothetical protein